MTEQPSVSELQRAVSADVRARLAAGRQSGKWLAGQIGLSQNYVAKRLRDEAAFTLDDLAAIARALRLSPRDWLASLGAYGMSGSPLIAQQRLTSSGAAVATLRGDPGAAKRTVQALGAQPAAADDPDDLPDWLTLAAHTDTSPTDRERFDAEMGDWEPS